MPVEPREAAGKGTHRVFVVSAHHHPHGEVAERNGGSGVERLAGGLERFGDADGIHDDVVGLAAGRGGGDLLEVVVIEGAGAAALHLLEIVPAPHVAHEQQAFERLDVGAGGHHVHGHGDARVVVVAELREDGFRVFGGFVGDLLAELVALAELLAHRLDDVVGVAVGLGEDERFRNFGAARKYLRPLVPKGADDGANLVRVDDGTVQFLAGIDDGLVLNFPALAARQPLALLDLLMRPGLAAALRPQRVDGVDFVADVDAIGDGLLVAVFADDVRFEEPIGAVVRGGRQADEIGVEVFQDLAPQVVNRAVAFVDDDEVEELGRNVRVVDDRHGLSGLHHLRRVALLGGLVHLLVPQQRVHALDGADADLAVPGDVGRLEALDVV